MRNAIVSVIAALAFPLACIPAPAISNYPLAQSVEIGTQATFSVSVTGTNQAWFQWFSDGLIIPGATGSTLSIKARDRDNGRLFYCIVSNQSGSVTSGVAPLTVLSKSGFIGVVSFAKSNTIGLAWDHAPGTGLYYEVFSKWLDVTQQYATAVGRTESNVFTVARPKSGHFEYMVRTCKDSWSPSLHPTSTTYTVILDGKMHYFLGNKHWMTNSITNTFYSFSYEFTDEVTRFSISITNTTPTNASYVTFWSMLSEWARSADLSSMVPNPTNQAFDEIMEHRLPWIIYWSMPAPSQVVVE